MSDKLQKRIIFGFLGAIVLYFAALRGRGNPRRGGEAGDSPAGGL